MNLRIAGMREWRNWCVLELKMTARDRDQSRKFDITSKLFGILGEIEDSMK